MKLEAANTKKKSLKIKLTAFVNLKRRIYIEDIVVGFPRQRWQRKQTPPDIFIKCEDNNDTTYKRKKNVLKGAFTHPILTFFNACIFNFNSNFPNEKVTHCCFLKLDYQNTLGLVYLSLKMHAFFACINRMWHLSSKAC